MCKMFKQIHQNYNHDGYSQSCLPTLKWNPLTWGRLEVKCKVIYSICFMCVWTMIVVAIDMVMHNNYLKCLFCCLVKPYLG
jgi:hypothetical protein